MAKWRGKRSNTWLAAWREKVRRLQGLQEVSAKPAGRPIGVAPEEIMCPVCKKKSPAARRICGWCGLRIGTKDIKLGGLG